MSKISFKTCIFWRAVLSAAVLLAVSISSGPAMCAEGMDPDAGNILQSMSSYLGGTKAFSVNADIDFEIVTGNGQKLQLSSYATAVLKRPQKFHIQRKGMIADVELIYDGKVLTLYGKKRNIYAQVPITGTIDEAFLAYELEAGIPAPGADLLFADPYAILSSGVESAVYVGTTYINGVECYHLAFREAKVDWQLWVKTGDEPLPMKYVITSKWVTGSPQYEIRFRDWNTSPRISDNLFIFSVPAGAMRLENIVVNEMGEFTSTEEGK